MMMMTTAIERAQVSSQLRNLREIMDKSVCTFQVMMKTPGTCRGPLFLVLR